MFEIYKRYLSINLKDYNNIDIDLEIGMIMLAFTVGIIIAAVIISLQKNAMVSLIKKLTRQKAVDEDSAKSLSELKTSGITGFMCRSLLKSSVRIKRLVGRAGEREYSYEEYVALTKKKKKKKSEGKDIAENTETSAETSDIPNGKIDYSNARFYLKDKDSLETLKLMETRTSSPFNTALFCVLVICVYVCLTLLMPEILTLINNSLAK